MCTLRWLASSWLRRVARPESSPPTPPRPDRVGSCCKGAHRWPALRSQALRSQRGAGGTMMLRPQFVLRAASTCWRAGSLRHRYRPQPTPALPSTPRLNVCRPAPSPLLAGSANRRPAAPAACRWLSALAEGTEDDTSAVAADPPSAHPSARKSWAKVSPELFQEEYTLEEALAHIKENGEKPPLPLLPRQLDAVWSVRCRAAMALPLLAARAARS